MNKLGHENAALVLLCNAKEMRLQPVMHCMPIFNSELQQDSILIVKLM